MAAPVESLLNRSVSLSKATRGQPGLLAHARPKHVLNSVRPTGWIGCRLNQFHNPLQQEGVTRRIRQDGPWSLSSQAPILTEPGCESEVLMKSLITYAGVILAALIMVASTSAATEVRCSSHQTAKVELTCGHRAFHYDASKARWIKHHTTRYRVLFARPIKHSLGFYQWRMRVDRGWIRQAHRRLYRPIASAPAGFPPHHALWVCLGSVEGSPTSDNGSHFGMLQMTYNWMGLIKGKASWYPQVVQEWAAEKAYAENHYSPSFIYNQWLKWEYGAGNKCLSLE